MNMKPTILPWLALAIACAATSCVQDRAPRNGVFNENQYVRKDFLTRAGDDTQPDPGWFMQVSITQASSPNPLASVGGASLFPGIQSSGFGSPNRVRFAITQDKLQILDMRELNSDPTTAAQGLQTAAIVNAWPVTNVDLKYRVNLDGETTNFYEENQELDWQVRQFVKLNFAKNDPSDLAPFFASLQPVLSQCTNAGETSATLVPNSFLVDTDNGYMEFGVSLSIPISYSAENAATCQEAFGAAAIPFSQLGRSTVTLNLLYSFVRPSKFPGNPLDGSYVPMPLAEKDPIRHKYGAIGVTPIYRDPSTGLLGATEFVARYHPNKDITFYLAPGMPDVYKQYFIATGGIVDQTNAVLAKSGATGKLRILNYNDAAAYGDGKGPARKFGDVRYSFIVWHSDLELDEGLLGVEQQFSDPLTGQTLSSSVNVWEGRFKDTVQQRLDLFLQTVGAEYLTPSGEFDDTKYPASCVDGQTVPLVDGDIAGKLNSGSTVFGKMQAYLQKPVTQYGNLGPANFVPQHDADFYNAYFAVLPYQVFADPAANQFVVPEGSLFSSTAQAMQDNWQGLQNLAQFDQLAASIDHGSPQFDTAGQQSSITQGLAFAHQFNSLSLAVSNYDHVLARRPYNMRADDISMFSYFDIYQKNGRHCVNGKWESRADYTTHLITSLNAAVAMHEFGHALGLDHNFMGSIDQRNFPTDSQGKVTLYSSSIMEYSQQLSEAFFLTPGTPWPPYDQAALGWIYGNNHDLAHIGPVTASGVAPGISGQVSPSAPWNDPMGFQADGTTERTFLFCTNKHVTYTPLCRPYDIGVTPAEIIANEIQQREWNYLWTNFRLYHKYFDLSNYGQTTVRSFNEYRRFLSLWNYDWSSGKLTNTLRLIGVNPPAGTTAAEYYAQLTGKFNNDVSFANQLVGSYHRAIIDQASGERPYITVFDPFYGDTTQQGIQIDKVASINSFSSLWPAISNYDPSQTGETLTSSSFGQDASYNQLAASVMLDFLGASFATYTYAQIGPMIAFAESTHSTWWPATSPAQAWIGGITFDRERDFLDYIHTYAVKYAFPNCDENGLNCQPCTSLDNCTWDPRTLQVKPSQITQSDRYNRFQAPDGRTYIWMYMASRNQWLLADKDRNVAMYTLMLNWSTDVVNGEDDGNMYPPGAIALELKIRYAIDAYQYFNGYQPNSP